MRTLACLPLFIAASVTLVAQQKPNPKFRDTAVIGAFRQIDPAMVHFTTLHRERVAADLDIALVRGGAPTAAWGQRDDLRFVSDGDLLGLFLLSRTSPDLAYTLTIDAEAVSPGGRIEIVWAGPGAIVLSRSGDYGFQAPRLKYFFDAKAKRLLARREFSVGAAVVQGPLGSRRLAAVEDDPGSGRRGGSACDESVRFGEQRQYSLGAATVGSHSLLGCVVTRSDGASQSVFSVPRSSQSTFVAARPQRARAYLAPAAAEFNETIGPSQVFDNRLWFGLSFYDGEGLTGVGGFGWFDPATERFELIRPPEMADWSASAILVTEDAVWLGLKRRPEGAEYSGGLLRWNRGTQEVEHWPDLPLIYELERDGAKLLAAGEGGGAIFDGERLELYLTDVDRAGRYRLVRRGEER